MHSSQTEQQVQTEVDMRAIKARIAILLDVNDNSHWSIIDSVPDQGLYLVHYNKNAPLDTYGKLRGVVVHVPAVQPGSTKELNSIIVCRSYPYAPVVDMDEIVPDENGNITFTDEFGKTYRNTQKTVRFRYGLDGVIVRVFLFNSRIYISTHRKINITNTDSRWGDSPSFYELYTTQGGPPGDQLFDMGKLYSPYVHIFLIQHPMLLNSSRIMVGNSNISYLGILEVWPIDEQYYPSELVDEKIRVPAPSIDNDISFFHLRYLSLEDANEYLERGMFQDDVQVSDPRLGTGEHIYAYIYNDNMTVETVLQVRSTARAWREETRGEDSSLLYRFFTLMRESMCPHPFIKTNKPKPTEQECIQQFEQLFPTLAYYSKSAIVDRVNNPDIPLVTWPMGKVNPALLKMVKGKQYMIWCCFLIAVPIERQPEVLGMLSYYYDNIPIIGEWIVSLRSMDRSDLMKINKRIPSILDLAIQQTSKQSASVTDELLIPKIINILNWELGDSYYRLISSKKRYENKLDYEKTRITPLTQEQVQEQLQTQPQIQMQILPQAYEEETEELDTF